MSDLIVGLALVLVIEGIVYAAFPDQTKAMMARFLQMPSSSLRTGGLVALVAGVFIVWLVRG
ncbi:MAG: DUF2065 domain-containing protein [Hyphomicrobiales bacterium]